MANVMPQRGEGAPRTLPDRPGEGGGSRPMPAGGQHSKPASEKTHGIAVCPEEPRYTLMPPQYRGQ